MEYRRSRQREYILKVLRGTCSHPTAEWVYHTAKKKIPDLSIGTVYRNLKILVDQGLVKKLAFGSAFDRYDATVKQHYHFVCEQCGDVRDVDLPIRPDIDTEVEKRNNCTISHHKIDFFGSCEKCSNGNN